MRSRLLPVVRVRALLVVSLLAIVACAAGAQELDTSSEWPNSSLPGRPISVIHLQFVSAQVERLEELYARARNESLPRAAYAARLEPLLSTTYDELERRLDDPPARLHPFSVAALSSLAMARPDYLEPDPRNEGVDSATAELLRLVLWGERADALSRYELDPVAQFVLGVAEPLFRLASPRGARRLAEALGLDPFDTGHAASGLYALRAIAARRAGRLADANAAAGADPADGAPHSSRFEGFLADGRELAQAVEFRRAEDAPRSGDEYRWAMLSVLSHPYAQHVLDLDPNLRDARDMVAAFASRTHDEALRSVATARPVVSAANPGGVAPFVREYRVADDATAVALLRAFVAAAQGVSTLGPEFDHTFVGDLSVAAHWSYTHGLSVTVAHDTLADSFDARVTPWFMLGWAAMVPEEKMGLEYRGTAVLLEMIRESVSAPVEAARIVGLESYAPRLNVALDVFDRVMDFDVEPAVALETVARLYGLEPARNGVETERLIPEIVDEIERLIVRLSRVEIPDARRSTDGGAP